MDLENPLVYGKDFLFYLAKFSCRLYYDKIFEPAVEIHPIVSQLL